MNNMTNSSVQSSEFAVTLVSDAKYQRYLNHVLRQLHGCRHDVHLIARNDVSSPEWVKRHDPSDFIKKVGLDVPFLKHDHFRTSVTKMAIPYIDELAKYSKILYIDSDVVLNDGWDSVFELGCTSKYMMTTNDIMMPESLARGYPMPFYKYYGVRKYTYGQCGVILFDNRFRDSFMPIEDMRTWVSRCRDEQFWYAEQCMMNAADAVECTLPERYNCYRWRCHIVDKPLIVHYTAEVGVKDIFDKILSDEEAKLP